MIEKKNIVENNFQKPETPLWQISSTQTPVVPTSSSIETSSTSLGPTPTSQGIQSPSSSSSVSVSQSHNTARDEIYIDDEGLEGSGGRGEVRICQKKFIFLNKSLYFSISDSKCLTFFLPNSNICRVHIIQKKNNIHDVCHLQ